MAWAWVNDPSSSGPGYWYNSDTGQRGGNNPSTPPAGVSPQSAVPVEAPNQTAPGDAPSGVTYTPATASPAGTGATSAAPAAPIAPPTANAPYATTTIGYQGNMGLTGSQQPGIFGTGTYIADPYAINDQAITGQPNAPAADNYGLNNVWQNLQNAVGNLKPQDYSFQATQLGNAPTFAAPTGTAASGTAAQGSAAQTGYATGRASTGTGASFSAPTGTAALMPGARISTAGDAAWQSQQQGLANILATQAAGGGVSPADLQLRAGTDQSVAAALAALGSQRGLVNSPALAARAALDNQAAQNATLNQQMGIQRAEETLQAQNALGNVLATGRGQAQAYNLNQAQLAQAAQQSNINARNAMTSQNLSDILAANQGNAGLSQQMGLANLGFENAQTQQNVGNAQAANLANLQARNAMISQNLTAQNQFGLQNVENAQAMNLANMSTAEQQQLANQNMLGQFGLQQGQIDQQTALANQAAREASVNQYYNQFNALAGAQTGIGESNRAAALADQQLQVQQQIAANQVNAQAYAASAGNNANLAASALAAGGAVLSQLLASGAVKAATNGSGQTVYTNSATGYSTTNPQDPNLYQDLPTSDIGGTGYGVNPAGGYSPSGSNVDTSGTSTDFTDNPYGTTNSLAVDPNSPLGQAIARSDRRSKTAIRSARASMMRDIFALCDENLKTGIEGGNPMMQSFLKQYDQFEQKDPNVEVTAGENFRLNRSQGTNASVTGGNHSGSQTGGAIGGAIGGAAAGAALGSVIPVVGTAIGGLAGAFVGSQVGSDIGGQSDTPGHMNPGQAGTVTATGEIGNENLSDAPDWQKLEAQSDDNEKEAVLSGNRGLQSFLQQQGAQQNAQNQASSYSNSFMQTGTAPQTQVDRVMPAGNINAGYGANLQPNPYGSAAGVQSYGGYQGSTWQPMQGMSYGGGVTGGGITQGATMNAGGFSGGSQTSQGNGTPNVVPNADGTVMLPNFMQSLTVNSKNDPYANVTIPPFAAQPAIPTTNTPGTSSALTGDTGVIGGLQTSTAPPTSTRPRLVISDEEQKEDIQPSPDETKGMLDKLHAYSYRYKDPSAPGAAPGRRLGVMAQDLEKSPLGASFVRDTPNGKMVNYGQAAGTMMAALAYHNERHDDHDARLAELERLVRASHG